MGSDACLAAVDYCIGLVDRNRRYTYKAHMHAHARAHAHTLPLTHSRARAHTHTQLGSTRPLLRVRLGASSGQSSRPCRGRHRHIRRLLPPRPRSLGLCRYTELHRSRLVAWGVDILSVLAHSPSRCCPTFIARRLLQ